MHALDDTDRAIIRCLRADGRMSNAALAEAVGLSASACLRRLRLLEHRGVIRGYTAIVEEAAPREGVTVIVQITLEKQTDDSMRRFEEAVRRCPEVRECHLMTGMSDYLLRVEAHHLAVGEEERAASDAGRLQEAAEERERAAQTGPPRFEVYLGPEELDQGVTRRGAMEGAGQVAEESADLPGKGGRHVRAGPGDAQPAQQLDAAGRR